MARIDTRSAILWLCAVLLTGSTAVGNRTSGSQVECWDIFEISLQGPSSGNPFVDVRLRARFRQGDRVFTPEGFYDGEGLYKIRFMPDAPGQWTYVTESNRQELDGKRGAFTCVEAGPGNHGPVRVHNRLQLAYADGTPHFSVGTTCYAWAHQGDAMEEQTLATLKNAPFNKMRMCVFPKSYTYNKNEPVHYPYVGKPLKDWDFARFNPAFWRHFEKRVGQLRDLGIEADIILWHPYDRWGFAEMGSENDDRYLRYAIARLSAYRNVWWSLANEYDLMAPGAMAGHRGDTASGGPARSVAGGGLADAGGLRRQPHAQRHGRTGVDDVDGRVDPPADTGAVLRQPRGPDPPDTDRRRHRAGCDPGRRARPGQARDVRGPAASALDALRDIRRRGDLRGLRHTRLSADTRRCPPDSLPAERGAPL